MTEESTPHDPTGARSERCDLQLPADPDQARMLLRVLSDAATNALTLLDLDDHDLDAWARNDVDALSPKAVDATTDGEFATTSYRDELGIIAEELGILLKGAPPPREEIGGGTYECHVLFSNEEDLEGFLADGVA